MHYRTHRVDDDLAGQAGAHTTLSASSFSHSSRHSAAAAMTMTTTARAPSRRGRSNVSSISSSSSSDGGTLAHKDDDSSEAALDNSYIRHDSEDDGNAAATASAAAAAECLQVAVRVRPPLPRELHDRLHPYVAVVEADTARACVTLTELLDAPTDAHHNSNSTAAAAVVASSFASSQHETTTVYARQCFAFDHVYDMHTTQEAVYASCARPAVRAVLRGYNATVMAYGQTGTGKTYTMEGSMHDTTTTTVAAASSSAASTPSSSRGVIPRAVEDVFAHMHAHNAHRRFLVRVSFLQIYNESLFDLLASSSSSSSSSLAVTTPTSLMVRHTPQHGVHVEGLSEWVVRRPHDVYKLLARGSARRATATTRLSALSSRSHAIFTMTVESAHNDNDNNHEDDDDDDDDDSMYATRSAAATAAAGRGRSVCGKLHFVDLAGSEKVRRAGVTGARLRETRNINRSLHELGNVIAALARRDARHVPFRNSQLTSVLRDALGGNCKTTLIACVSPALDAYSESLSTLLFAARAQRVRTHATINTAPLPPSSSSASALADDDHNRQQQQQLLLARVQQQYEQELTWLRRQLAAYRARDPQQQQQHAHDNEDGEDDDGDGGGDAYVATLRELQHMTAAHAREQRQRRALQERVRALEQALPPQQRLRHVGMDDAMADDDNDSSSSSNDKSSSSACTRARHSRLLHRDVVATAAGHDGDDVVQASRYKQLLLLQREALLDCTVRLRERDEVILQLQDEIDAYDTHVQQLESALAAAATRTAAIAGSSPARVRHDGDDDNDAHEDVRVLREELSARAEAVALQRYAAQRRAAVQQRRVLRARLRVATATSQAWQDMVNILTRTSDTYKSNNNNDSDDNDNDSSSSSARTQLVRECCARVEAHVRDALCDAAATLSQHAAHDTAVRRRLMCELDRARFALSQMQSRATAAYTSAQRAEVSELWQALQLVEHGLLAEEDEDEEDGDDDSTATADDTTRVRDAQTAVWRQQVAALQAMVRRLQQQQHEERAAAKGVRDVAVATYEQQQLQQLQRDMAAHVRDRAALLSILQHRAQPKADLICSLVARVVAAVNAATAGDDNDDVVNNNIDNNSGATAAVLLLRRRDSNTLEQLQHATRSLQSLIAASVKAMLES